MRVAIVGAGIVGVAVAHALLDEGHAVELVDRAGFAAGASAGNAGWIAHVDILPLASPKAWRHLPRWLADPLGPLAIRPQYLPALAPWFARFVAASRPARIEAGTVALAALNGLALPAWEPRLAALGLDGHLRRKGILTVWSDAAAFRAFMPIAERQRGFGIPVEILDPKGVAALEPALRNVAGGALHPTGAHVSDPAVLTTALGEKALERGARLRIGSVDRVERKGDGLVLSSAGAPVTTADRIVIATGAWSKPLARRLGDAIPLDTERGYNITLSPGALGINRPVMFEGHGFVVTPLDTGDRIGGSVEFAGLDAPPNYARVDAILGRLRRFMPDLPKVEGTRWMGFRPSIPDSLPVIGPSTREPGVVYAFGHGHYGLTQAAATADLVAAALAGRPAPIDVSPYSPRRF